MVYSESLIHIFGQCLKEHIVLNMLADLREDATDFFFIPVAEQL